MRRGDSFVGCNSYAVCRRCTIQKSVCNRREILECCFGKSRYSVLWGSNGRCFEDLHEMPSSKNGLHYPYTIQTLQLMKLFRKPCCSVMVQIDMFAVSSALLPRIRDFLDLKRLQSTHHLRNVYQFKVKEIIFDTGLC